jgi:hypothetical protein
MYTLTDMLKIIGCAASLIEGKTTHHIGRIPVGNRSKVLSNKTKKELANIWQHVCYLIIGEYSMISKEFLAQLSRHVSIVNWGPIWTLVCPLLEASTSFYAAIYISSPWWLHLQVEHYIIPRRRPTLGSQLTPELGTQYTRSSTQW